MGSAIMLIDHPIVGTVFSGKTEKKDALLEQRIVIISPSHRKEGRSVKVADMDLAAALAQAFVGWTYMDVKE